MSKVSVRNSNKYAGCPQPLFLYGTYREDGAPNFGLFCWFSYCWDGEWKVMACIGGEKLTKERILKNKVFSANLVTRDILPLADYLGNTDGHNPEKMQRPMGIEKGRTLDVPILSDSPLAFELEVSREIPLDDGIIFICRVADVLGEEYLADTSVDLARRMAMLAPVFTVAQTYFSWEGERLAAWGEYAPEGQHGE